MRRLVPAFLVLALAAPAAGQPLNAFQLDALRAEQSLAQIRALSEANERASVEARIRAEQTLTDLAIQRALPARAPEPPYPSATPPAPLDISKLPKIPDAALAESNRRVQEAVKNRR